MSKILLIPKDLAKEIKALFSGNTNIITMLENADARLPQEIRDRCEARLKFSAEQLIKWEKDSFIKKPFELAREVIRCRQIADELQKTVFVAQIAQ